MDLLVKQQGNQVKVIQKVHNQLKKDSTARKTREYAESRAVTLNHAWTEVEKLNAQIEVYKDQNPQHKYFTENYYVQIETLYEQTREQLEEIIRDAMERKKNSETIAEQLKLMKKQGAIIDTLKRSILMIEKELASQTSSAYLVQKIKLLNDYWEHIVLNHGEIMALGKFKDEYFDEQVFPKTEDLYQTTLIKLQERLEGISTPTTASPNRITENHTKLKLPRIDIPDFNGDYLKWQSFRDLFTELIHKDEKIANAEKLFYLKANLKGEPNELIQHLHVSNENYQTAWNILDKRYNNKRTLVSAQLRTLLNQPELTKESAEGLKRLHDITTECLEAIKNLGINIVNWDPLVIHLITQKLDKESRRIYEQSLKKPREVQELKDFLEFIETRFQGLEAMEPARQNQATKHSEKKGNDVKVHYGAIGRISCAFCKGDHRIYSCEKFTKLNATQKNDEIRKAKLCTNCLGKGHSAGVCKSWKVCKICNKKHHTLLHLNPLEQKSMKTQNTKHVINNEKGRLERNNATTSEVATHIAENQMQNTVLLATAIIQAVGKNGREIMLRALIDQGAQATFIKEDVTQQLQVQKRRIQAVVTGVGQARVDNVQTCVKVTIKPRFPSTFSIVTTALVLKKLTNIMPAEKIVPNCWEHTRNLVLADPKYDIPGRIDLILGADVFGKILMENVLRGPPGSPIAQQTELGWILSGEVQSNSPTKTIQCCISEVDVNKELRKFWETEELSTEPIVTNEDLACENHFRTTHRRDADGRYIVRIPFKEDPEKAELSGTRELALARLFQMERKFKTNKKFEIMYKDFMNEYQQLGHMVPATANMGKTYYLPHHAVLKQESTTTKLRVVFDASAKRHNTKSLNEIMSIGPQIQQNLISILLRWRKHKVVFTADVEKMYRQIKIDIRDQNYQRVLWRNSPEEPIKEYNLTTVTYGTAAAPFLAIRTLQQLARDNAKNYPMAERVMLHDTYVDDIVSGGNSLEETVEVSKQLINSLKQGGFNLRKWTSNSRDLLQEIPWQLREQASDLDLDQERTIKALGVHWNPSTDKFKIQINKDYDWLPSTKRELLSEAAKIFDPIGLLAPITIKVKLLFQEIWIKELEWDERLPEETKLKWKRIKSELPRLTKIEIPRWLGYTRNGCQCELHGFSDASEKAYSAVIYIRIIQQGRISTTLLTAKTKVAPLKSKLTLPRLELCGATLLANLLKEARESLEIEELSYFAWTDSKIVISWIQEDAHRWKTFVGNRVAEIQSLTESKRWFHVKSSENPADIASRGIFPSQLEENLLWWEGPLWLKNERITYPKNEIRKTDLERRKILINTITHQEDDDALDSIAQRYSSLRKLQRIVAYCIRFIKNIKENKGKQGTSAITIKKIDEVPPLTIKEKDDALLLVIRHIQGRHFNEELLKLNKQQEVQKTSRLVTLTPFLDSNGVIRVGGRLENAALTFEQKHPIILPYKSELTTLIIDEAHKETLHGGNTLTLQVIRQKYWILNGLKAVKGHIHKCIKCHRYKAQMTQQMMGMLPKARVTPSRPFTHTGIDYAGPFEMLLAKGRGKNTYKAYLAIFICLTTKAIHIEVVTDLTSRAFIAAFKRLVGRRGPVAHLYSDNATNFVGASKIISDLHQQERHKTEVNEALKEVGTQWHFIPPSSPHFGGLWEAGVKSIKYHMRRVIGETKLTYEEMCTLMTQIEACLNSRPLCPLSEDPESLDVLTPGHFLTGSAILTVPDKEHLDTNTNLLNRWDRLERMYQEFWKKWSVEYIGRLQHRPKWTQKQINIKIGNLVLIKEDYLPPSRWALGRVIETHPGADGLTRAVTIQTKNGKMKRPITKISLLPVIENKDTATSDSAMYMPNEEVDSDSEPEPTVKSSIATNTVTINKGTSSRRKRRTNEYSDEPITSKLSRQEQESRRRISTQPHRSSKWSYLCLLALFVFVALAEDSNKPYTLTKLTNHEGIYFDDIGEIQLYSSEWNLLVYYDLSTYWKELIGIRKSIRRLTSLCEEEVRLSRELCTATIQQLNHQMLESEHMNEILYQQNEHSRIRSKRAPLEIIGTISNKLFGILDQEFADKYERQIHEIKENENLVRQLLRNQTSIMENTINVMKKDHDTVERQINMVENQIEAITTKLNHSQYELMTGQAFNSAAILLILCLYTFQNIQRSILSVVMDTRHGQVNTLLLTPAQLNDQLTIIREHLPPTLRLPGNRSSTSLMAIYNSMHVNIRTTKNNVLFDIRIPLLNTESYHLYELIPIPTIHNDKYIYIEPSSKYLAVNRQRDRFNPMREEDLNACQRVADAQLICSLKQPIFTLKANQSHCEIELLSNVQRLSPFCKLRTREMENIWIKLHSTSTWLFILREETYFDIICQQAVYPLSLNGTGIIQLQQDCIINHPTLSINSNNKIQGKIRSSFIPQHQVISNHLNLSAKVIADTSRLTIPQLIKDVNSNDLAELDESIKAQQQRIDNIPNINIHDLHHYSSTYLLIIIAIVIGLYLKYGRQKIFVRGKINKPMPAPRRTSGREERRSSIELPSLKIEGGECMEYI